MKKTIVTIILTAALTISFTACASESPVNSGQLSLAEAPTEESVEAASIEESVAEEVFSEETTEAAVTDAEPEEYSKEAVSRAADNSAPTVDISGCDTFTQIVDRKLENGMGYANATVGDADLLLVSSGTYDNLDENTAAIDAALFMYTEDAIAEVGKVCSGGTSYPLTVKDGYLYTGSNHWICKYTMENGKLILIEKASVEYDEEGNGTYYFESEDESVNTDLTAAEAEKVMNDLYDEMMAGEVVDFSTVNK